MAAKKVGELIKEARTSAGLSQTALAEQVDGVTAAQIGKAERGELDLTQAQLKQIAKATGVTQSSLLNAPKSTSAKTSSAKASAAKTSSSAKTSSAKKTSSSAKTSSAKKTSSSAKKTSSAKTSSAKKTGSSTDLKLTATEKKLVELYRKAESGNKKLAMKVLSGEKLGVEDVIPVTSLLGGTLGGFMKK